MKIILFTVFVLLLVSYVLFGEVFQIFLPEEKVQIEATNNESAGTDSPSISSEIIKDGGDPGVLQKGDD